MFFSKKEILATEWKYIEDFSDTYWERMVLREN